MGEIIDFEKFKQTNARGNKLEENYLKFLGVVNKFTGVPHTFEKCTEIFYYTLRYLEGTVNCLSLLTLFSHNAPRKEIEQMKHLIITWLEQLIDDIKNI